MDSEAPDDIEDLYEASYDFSRAWERMRTAPPSSTSKAIPFAALMVCIRDMLAHSTPEAREAFKCWFVQQCIELSDD